MSMEKFETQDFCLAATVHCFGNPVAGVEMGEEGRATFHFENVPECSRLLEGFWRYQLQVEPRAYFNALKAIKARLYAR